MRLSAGNICRANILAAVLMLLISSSCAAAPASKQQSTVFTPALRLERVVRLAQAYKPAPANALAALEMSPEVMIDGNLTDWPASPEGAIMSLGGGEDLAVIMHSGWDAKALYLAFEIQDDIAVSPIDGDLFSGDLLILSLAADKEQKVESGQVFLIAPAAPQAKVLNLNGTGKPVPGSSSAVFESEGTRTLELRLPWAQFAPKALFSERKIQLTLSLEDCDETGENLSSQPQTYREEVCLVLLPGESRKIDGYLSLKDMSVPSGEQMEGTLFIDAPQPQEKVRVGLEIAALIKSDKAITAAGEEVTVIRIAKELALEQGINTFRLFWNSADQTNGDYLVRATASSVEGKLFSLQAPFKIEVQPNEHERLQDYGKRLAVEVALERAKQVRETQADKPLKFAVMGDCRDGEKIFVELLNEAAAQGAEFVIVTGDLVSKGTMPEYLRLAEILESAPLPVLPLVGNHDVVGKGRLYWRQLFGPTNYSFDLGGCRFILADNSYSRLTAAQLEWMESQLQTEKTEFVFVHAPPATIERWSWHAFSQGADEFVQLMEEARPSRVFVSHIHAYDRLVRNGLVWVLSGGAGAPLYPQMDATKAFHHFVLVEVTPEGVTDAVVSLVWQKAPAQATPQPEPQALPVTPAAEESSVEAPAESPATVGEQ